MRLADPKPAICSACWKSSSADDGQKWVDFEVNFDGVPVLTEEGTIAVLPGSIGQVSHDNLYLCESCLKAACEMVGLKPEMHTRVLQRNRRLELEKHGLLQRVKSLTEEIARLGEQIDDSAPPRVGRPPKQRVEV